MSFKLCAVIAAFLLGMSMLSIAYIGLYNLTDVKGEWIMVEKNDKVTPVKVDPKDQDDLYKAHQEEMARKAADRKGKD